MAKPKPEDWDKKITEVLELVSEGESVRQACEAVGIARRTFRDKVDAAQYARARESCADTQFDEMSDLETELLNGNLDYNVFKAAMDARKWRLSKMKPKVYGDKLPADQGEMMGAILDRMTTIADIINSPQPQRNIADYEEK